MADGLHCEFSEFRVRSVKAEDDGILADFNLVHSFKWLTSITGNV